jgi:hypothetical protein
MILPGARGQQNRDLMFDASGTIASGGTAQLLLPEVKSRSLLFIQNIDSAHDLVVEFGGARATATLTNGVVTSVSVTNAGFGYTFPPEVEFLGGGNSGNPPWLGAGLPGYPAPGDPAYVAARYFDLSGQKAAKGHATLSGGAVSAIVIEDGGKGYSVAPFVRITNALQDPVGAAIPSATSGILLAHGQSLYFNGPACPTDQISIFGATTSTPFTVKWIP